jgi:hypothetical protein
MAFLKVLLLIFTYIKISEAIIKIPLCNETILATEVKLCTNESYQANLPPFPFPHHIEPILDIYDITNVNVDDQTLTMLVDLIFLWNETRVNMVSLDNYIDRCLNFLVILNGNSLRFERSVFVVPKKLQLFLNFQKIQKSYLLLNIQSLHIPAPHHWTHTFKKSFL